MTGLRAWFRERRLRRIEIEGFLDGRLSRRSLKALAAAVGEGDR